MDDMTIEEELSITCEQRDALDIECARLEKENEVLRKDAEMLRWLANEWDKNGNVAFRRYAHGTAGCELFTVTTQHVRGYGFRGAIEAAMREHGANG